MSLNEPKKSRPAVIWWIGGLLMVCVVLLPGLRHSSQDSKETPLKTGQASSSLQLPAILRHRLTHSTSDPESAEAIVARKLTQFAQKQRAIFEAMATRHRVAVPDNVKRFFDAIEAGHLDEAQALYKTLRDSKNPSGSQTDDIRPFWRAIEDTWGAAMMAQRMPAQEFLNYGNAILNSLQPGMIYVGGTDPGMFIPNMLNATSDGEQHVVLTQNALADASYLDYLNDLYGNQLKTLTAADEQQAFQDYLQDAQKRLLHDQQFPDDPKQVLPGEDISIQDGQVNVSGQVAVMSINERLLQTLMQNNPDFSFGLEESFPLKSTYPGAVPLGPIMQLGEQGNPGAFSADIAAQTVSYWQNSAEQLLANPEAAASSDTLLTYSHDAVAQANLLAAHDYSAEAEQAYNIARQLAPSSFEAVAGLSAVLYQTGQANQAIQILNDFAQKNPSQQAAVNLQRGFFTSE